MDRTVVAAQRNSALARGVMGRADLLASFTEERGRITRSYGTQALLDARHEVINWCEQAGLRTSTDAIGNVIARWEPAGEPCGRTLLLGSHIDSVRNAGRYDGPLGVLVALAAIEAVRTDGEAPHVDVELVAFADEEGLRYRSSYLGSRVFAGVFDDAELEFVDSTGVSLRDAVRTMGGDPAALGCNFQRRDELIGYVEVHIEQGPVLEANDLPVGVVSSIAGQARGSITFTGTAGHAGTVPMRLRRDALCAAAEWIAASEQIALEEDGLVATVGQIAVQPCVGNVIVGSARLSYDIRHQDDATKERACSLLRDEAERIGRRREVAVNWESLQAHSAVPAAPWLVQLLGDAVETVGLPLHVMPSGAGHDAVPLSELTDVAMLFVRCQGGVSHHPDESVDEADVAAAIAVMVELLRTIDAPPA